MLNLNVFIANSRRVVAFGALAIGSVAFSCSASAAQPAQLFPFFLAPPTQVAPEPSVEAAPSEDEGSVFELPARLRRQVVSYATREAPGTVIIDTPNTYLYYVLGHGQALRYGIGVGRDGFTWAGVQSVTKKAEWPDWTPPPETIGTHVSSGCIRLTNDDVSDLYSRVNVGTKVIVLPMDRRADLADAVH